MWDVKEPTHYSKTVGREVPSVVAVLCGAPSLQQGGWLELLCLLKAKSV